MKYFFFIFNKLANKREMTTLAFTFNNRDNGGKKTDKKHTGLWEVQKCWNIKISEIKLILSKDIK